MVCVYDVVDELTEPYKVYTEGHIPTIYLVHTLMFCHFLGMAPGISQIIPYPALSQECAHFLVIFKLGLRASLSWMTFCKNWSPKFV